MRSIRLLPVALVALACAKEPAPAGAPAEATPQQVTITPPTLVTAAPLSCRPPRHPRDSGQEHTSILPLTEGRRST
jgi:hypothetical protein